MERWLDRPYLLLFPATGAVAAIELATRVRRRRDRVPFRMVSAIFAAALVSRSGGGVFGVARAGRRCDSFQQLACR